MNILGKIAQYFMSWDGEDEEVTDIKLSTKDLRFIVGLNRDKCKVKQREEFFKWHYLRNNPTDYPQYDDSCLVCYYDNDTEQNEYVLAWNPRNSSAWRNKNGFIQNVIAWKYIEPCGNEIR